MWTAEAEKRQVGQRPILLAEARSAFLSGYALTAALAVCFSIIGAGVMHPDGIAPETSAPGFAKQIIGLYSSVLGEGAAYLAAIAALSVMLTSLLAALDIGSRHIATTWQQTIGKSGEEAFNKTYRIAIPTLVASAGLVLLAFTSNFISMLDLATSAAFVGAPTSLC